MLLYHYTRKCMHNSYTLDSNCMAYSHVLQFILHTRTLICEYIYSVWVQSEPHDVSCGLLKVCACVCVWAVYFCSPRTSWKMSVNMSGLPFSFVRSSYVWRRMTLHLYYNAISLYYQANGTPNVILDRFSGSFESPNKLE